MKRRISRPVVTLIVVVWTILFMWFMIAKFG